MSKLRSMSMILILLSSAFSMITGRWLDHSSAAGTSSYRAVYYGARCLIDRTDPYNSSEFSRIYRSESGALPATPTQRALFLRAVMVCVNLPTTLFLLIPLALIPWKLSQLLWIALIGFSITFAAILAYDLTVEGHSRLPLILICFLMANSQVLFTVGNTAGIAIGLCVIAVWCFIRQRFVFWGVAALAISLALKPHDSGLIWLWLIASGSALRKRALQSAVLAVAIAIPAMLVVEHSSPQWRSELASNLAATSAHGDISDPGPASISRKGSADIIIDLQTVLSLYRDDPHFYNSGTYLFCGSLLVVWLFAAFHRTQSSAKAPFALAFLAALTMLVSYHRPYDAKLLLLAIPAISSIKPESGLLRAAALVLTSLAVFFTSDLPLAVLAIVTRGIEVSTTGLPARLFLLPVLRPAPIALSLMALIFLWLYVRHENADRAEVIATPRESPMTRGRQ
jgi:hypothetical protein